MPALRNRMRKARLERSRLDAELDRRQATKESVVAPTRLTSAQLAIVNIPVDPATGQPVPPPPSSSPPPPVSESRMEHLRQEAEIERTRISQLPPLTRDVLHADHASIPRNISYRGEYDGFPYQYQGPPDFAASHSLSLSSEAANDMTTTIVATPVPRPATGPATGPVAETPEMTMDIRNQAAIAEALTRANHALQSNRAENTKKLYTSKKKRWTAWCRRRAFADGETVTEGKLCLWLQEEVLKNGSQGRGNRKGSMLSPQGVEGYIKPIIDLYEV